MLSVSPNIEPRACCRNAERSNAEHFAFRSLALLPTTTTVFYRRELFPPHSISNKSYTTEKEGLAAPLDHPSVSIKHCNLLPSPPTGGGGRRIRGGLLLYSLRLLYYPRLRRSPEIRPSHRWMSWQDVQVRGKGYNILHRTRRTFAKTSRPLASYFVTPDTSENIISRNVVASTAPAPCSRKS